MKPIVALFLLPAGLLFAQKTPPAWDSFGLAGRSVYDLRMYGAKLYAATDTGVYACVIPDYWVKPTWALAGLAGKDVRSVYPHDVGPLGYAVTAGLHRRHGDPDSCLIYCSVGSDTSWAKADTGIDRSELNMIESIDGFPDPRVCGETFAGGSGKVYRRSIGGAWEKVFDFGVGVTNVVRARLEPPRVMAGGESAIFAPFIARSDDRGDSWTTALPWLGGDNACNSILFDPHDSSGIYAGMEGAVIRSTDGGETWISAGLSSSPYYFYGLAYAELYYMRDLFVVGATGSNEFGMFVEPIGDDRWAPVNPPWPVRGARCIVVAYAAAGSWRQLLIGTLGDGVLRYTDFYTSVEPADWPSRVQLHQNYPNPFNASSTVAYEIPARMHVRIDVVDVLGRGVLRVLDGEMPPGRHSVEIHTGDLSSGPYVCRLQAGDTARSVRMILIR